MVDFINNTPFGILLLIALVIGAIIGNIDANCMYKEVFGYWPSERHKHRWKSQAEREKESEKINKK